MPYTFCRTLDIDVLYGLFPFNYNAVNIFHMTVHVMHILVMNYVLAYAFVTSYHCMSSIWSSKLPLIKVAQFSYKWRSILTPPIASTSLSLYMLFSLASVLLITCSDSSFIGQPLLE